MLEYKEVPVPKIIHGDLEHYFELINFLENNDLSLAENYNQITSLIDINNKYLCARYNTANRVH